MVIKEMNKLINKICEDNFQYTTCEECNKPAELSIQYDTDNEFLCRKCYRKQLRESLNNHKDTHIEDFILMVKIMSKIEVVNN